MVWTYLAASGGLVCLDPKRTIRDASKACRLLSKRHPEAPWEIERIGGGRRWRRRGKRWEVVGPLLWSRPIAESSPIEKRKPDLAWRAGERVQW